MRAPRHHADLGSEKGRQTRLFFSGLALVLSASCTPALPPPEVLHYEVSAALDPAARSLRAETRISLPASFSGRTSAEFLLHRQLRVLALAGPEVEGYQVDTLTPPSLPWIPNAARVAVSFRKPLPEDRVTEIQVEYEGVVDTWSPWSANVVGEEWTELGLYFPWFPYFGADAGPFTFEVEAQMPEGLVARGLGEVDAMSGGWRLRSTDPVTDMVLVVAPELGTLEVHGKGQRVQIHYAQLREEEARRLGEEILGVLNTFAEWFGPPESRYFTLIESRREAGGGYAREGLVVMSRLSELMSPEAYPNLLRYLAHEVAHLWWHTAPKESWEDWLNESFAEYSALLLLRERLGEGEFRERLEAKEEAAQAVPPIWGLRRSDTSTEEKSRLVTTVLYSVGPVALDELAERISPETFLEWCRRMAALPYLSTSEALQLLEEVGGIEEARWFEDRLREGDAHRH